MKFYLPSFIILVNFGPRSNIVLLDHLLTEQDPIHKLYFFLILDPENLLIYKTQTISFNFGSSDLKDL